MTAVILIAVHPGNFLKRIIFHVIFLLSGTNGVDYICITEDTKIKAREFEELMDRELDALVRQTHYKQADSRTVSQKKNLKVRFQKTDADRDEDNVPIDKDPLCDYEEDEANLKWVQENLPGGQCKNSDAVLNCPGCMSVLSLDCHRHPHFKTQYYTEYPINCVVDETQVISRNILKPQRKSKSSTEGDLESRRNISKEYHIVNCKVCGNSVGRQDTKTNVIHFNNVLAGHS
uniref:E2F-associated phosphoprotein n=1 Tax=Trichobilharzia regenti TaxID=157069 RepID=A0AA85K0R1_TRIRE|nr:unnamed protein product [Trichobilharzia regenti]